MANVFSRATLQAFEDAAASIPLRQLDRAFTAAGIIVGVDPGGAEGTRRTQFRRYVAGVDQSKPHQLDRLGDALGALIAEVADSKISFLLDFARSDGFSFADGAFRATVTSPVSFAVRSVADFASIEERGRRLYLLANDRPNDAVAGAKALVESVCRTVLGALRKRVPARTAGLGDIASATLAALALMPPAVTDEHRLAGLVAAVAALCDPSEGTTDAVAARYARLAVGTAVALAAFVAESLEA